MLFCFLGVPVKYTMEAGDPVDSAHQVFGTCTVIK